MKSCQFTKKIFKVLVRRPKNERCYLGNLDLQYSVDVLLMFSRELTLFWSKLLMRLESSAEAFLGHSKEMALLCRSVCHILFLIKVIQNEVRRILNTFVADSRNII